MASVITVKALLPVPALQLTNEQAAYLTGWQITAWIHPKLIDKAKEHVSQLIAAISAQDLLWASASQGEQNDVVNEGK